MINILEPISTVMTTKMDKILITATVSEVKRLFAKHKYHHLPVVDGVKLVGIISTTDLMNLNIPDYGHDLIDKVIDKKFKLQDIISTDLATIEPDLSIQDTILIFLESDFHSLPIVDSKNNLLGIVTSKDLLKLLVQ